MKNIILLVFLFTTFLCNGQMQDYNYKQEIIERDNLWNKVEFSDEMYSKVKPDFSDVRIFGLTEENDTLEAPYVLNRSQNVISVKDFSCKILNQGKNKWWIFTIEVPDETEINQVDLDFEQENFDWKIWVEGSQNQKEWLTIVENYRVMSIKNSETDYNFTNVIFPKAKFKYFRFQVQTKDDLKLKNAKISLKETKKGDFKEFTVTDFFVKEDKKLKQTIVTIDFGKYIPIQELKINVNEVFDYYRKVNIQTVSDTIKTEKGEKYRYNNIGYGTLSSIEKNEFYLANRMINNIVLEINNNDNEPINVESLEIKQTKYWLVTRMKSSPKYYLTFGNKNAYSPNYDLERFKDGVSEENLKTVTLGSIMPLEHEVKDTIKPLFENKAWLWLIMALIIGLLGFASVRMMGKKN